MFCDSRGVLTKTRIIEEQTFGIDYSIWHKDGRISGHHKNDSGVLEFIEVGWLEADEPLDSVSVKNINTD